MEHVRNDARPNRHLVPGAYTLLHCRCCFLHSTKQEEGMRLDEPLQAFSYYTATLCNFIGIVRGDYTAFVVCCQGRNCNRVAGILYSPLYKVSHGVLFHAAFGVFPFLTFPLLLIPYTTELHSYPNMREASQPDTLKTTVAVKISRQFKNNCANHN